MIYFYEDYLFYLFFFLSVLSFCMFHKHVLMTLVVLEFLVLVLFFVLYIYMTSLGLFYFLIFFMVMSVCESCLGLSVLVSMIRSHGNDSLSTLFLLVW